MTFSWPTSPDRGINLHSSTFHSNPTLTVHHMMKLGGLGMIHRSREKRLFQLHVSLNEWEMVVLRLVGIFSKHPTCNLTASANQISEQESKQVLILRFVAVIRDEKERGMENFFPQHPRFCPCINFKATSFLTFAPCLSLPLQHLCNHRIIQWNRRHEEQPVATYIWGKKWRGLILEGKSH